MDQNTCYKLRSSTVFVNNNHNKAIEEQSLNSGKNKQSALN